MYYVNVFHDGQHVALVGAPVEDVPDALSYAWRWTNNVEGSWSHGRTLADGQPNGDFNALVDRMVPLHRDKDGRVYGLRSSMVGDVFEVVGGKRYRVATFGFVEEKLAKGLA
jgi:hypothetical protein